jgi:hypothetical protein
LSSCHIYQTSRVIIDKYDPYAILIFSGNNEWIEWRPPLEMVGEFQSKIFNIVSESGVGALLLWSLHIIKKKLDRGFF